MCMHVFEVFGADEFGVNPRSGFFYGCNESETSSSEKGYGKHFCLRIVGQRGLAYAFKPVPWY